MPAKPLAQTFGHTRGIPPQRLPRSRAAAPLSLAGVSHQAGPHRREAARNQVRREELDDEALFRLALDVNEYPRHRPDACSAGSGTGRPPNSFFSQSSPRL